LALAVALAGVGCGGDGDDEKSVGTGPPASTPTPAPTETKTQGRTQSTSPQGTSPEEQPGGAGDEVPARSVVLLTGRRGRIRPRLVRVAPFIAIRVELRSADGRAYGLRFGHKVLRAGPQVAAMSTTLPGLHQVQAVTGRLAGGSGNPVRIEASGEPGP
jgi:hypothetical protein